MSNGTNSISVMALLDSGADSTAISSNMAETLDLDTSGSRKRSYGVADSIESVSSEVALTIGNNHESYSLNVPVRVLFVDESEVGSFVPLIGRDAFFSEFRITFDEANSRIILKSHRN